MPKRTNTWTVSKDNDELNLNDGMFIFSVKTLLEQSLIFIILYGLKQFFASNFAACVTDAEKIDSLTKSAAKLVNPKMVFFRTDKSFGLHDPDAVKVTMTPLERAGKNLKVLCKERDVSIETFVKEGITKKRAKELVGMLLDKSINEAAELFEKLSEK